MEDSSSGWPGAQNVQAYRGTEHVQVSADGRHDNAARYAEAGTSIEFVVMCCHGASKVHPATKDLSRGCDAWHISLLI